MPRPSAAMLTVAVCASTLTALAPTAQADSVVDGVSTSIDAMRARTGCPPLTHSPTLDAVAAQYLRTGVPTPNGYPGYLSPRRATGRPAAAAVTQVLTITDGLITDCKNVDAGVSRLQNGDDTVIAVVLGSITGPQGAQGLR